MVLEHLRESGTLDEELFELLRSHPITGVDDYDNGRSDQTYDTRLPL